LFCFQRNPSCVNVNASTQTLVTFGKLIFLTLNIWLYKLNEFYIRNWKYVAAIACRQLGKVVVLFSTPVTTTVKRNRGSKGITAAWKPTDIYISTHWHYIIIIIPQCVTCVWSQLFFFSLSLEFGDPIIIQKPINYFNLCILGIILELNLYS